MPGDMRNTVATFQSLLRQLQGKGIKCNLHQEFSVDLLSGGDVPTALRYLHYVLLEWSLPVAKELIQHGHMYSENDHNFVTKAFRVLRDAFKYRPLLTPDMFLSQSQFCERRLLLLCDVTSLVLAKAKEANKIAGREGIRRTREGVALLEELRAGEEELMKRKMPLTPKDIDVFPDIEEVRALDVAGKGWNYVGEDSPPSTGSRSSTVSDCSSVLSKAGLRIVQNIPQHHLPLQVSRESGVRSGSGGPLLRPLSEATGGVVEAEGQKERRKTPSSPRSIRSVSPCAVPKPLAEGGAGGGECMLTTTVIALCDSMKQINARLILLEKRMKRIEHKLGGNTEPSSQ